MVQFLDVDPDDIPNHREGRRGRVSYPILKSFLETDKYVVQLDRTGMQQSFQALYSCLNSYIRNHELPIRIFSRSGEIYLMRTDVDKDGNTIENDGLTTTEGNAGALRDMEPVPLDGPEVERRYDEELNQTAK
jgi:hypothetical protein